MAVETEIEPESTTTPPETQVGDPAPTEAAPAQPPADPQPAPRPASRVLTIPTARMGEIKKAEREKGRLEAQTQNDVAAKALGYDSHEQLMTALTDQAAGRSSASHQEAEPSEPNYDAAPVAPAEPSDDPALRRSRRVTQLEKDRQKLLDDRKALNRARAHEARQRKALQDQIDAQAAEHELRFAAMRAGIQAEEDVDYAVTCLRRELKGKSADDLKGFDPADYFGKKLRTQRPYLYGEQTREATSSPDPQATGTNGGPPSPTNTNPSPGGADPVIDARKMNDEDYLALLRKNGLNHPSVGMPV